MLQAWEIPCIGDKSWANKPMDGVKKILLANISLSGLLTLAILGLPSKFILATMAALHLMH